jgi:hypothetical protein
MEKLKEYKKITEITETLYSIIIYNKSVIDITNFFEDQLQKSKKINNPIKKHKINNRLFNFIKYFKDLYDDDNTIINSIFLINDNIFSYELNKYEINILTTYNIFNIYIKCDTYFYIDTFIDILYNLEFIYTIKVNKNDMYIIKLNKNKEKEIYNNKLSNEQKIIDEIEKIKKDYNYKDIIIIYGISPYIGKIENIIKNNINQYNIFIIKDFCNKESLYNIYQDELMKKNHILLEKILNGLNNDKINTDLYVFGKLKIEIKDAIEAYMLKELYIEDKKLDNLKKFIDESLLNFKIIPIKMLENGDIGDNFIKNYNGLMGIKYY